MTARSSISDAVRPNLTLPHIWTDVLILSEKERERAKEGRREGEGGERERGKESGELVREFDNVFRTVIHPPLEPRPALADK